MYKRQALHITFNDGKLAIIDYNGAVYDYDKLKLVNGYILEIYKDNEVKKCLIFNYFKGYDEMCIRDRRHDIDIPIGLIAVNKGGTSGSCWINETYLQKNQEIKKVYYDEYYQAIMNQTEAQEDLEIAKYEERVKQYQQKVAL